MIQHERPQNFDFHVAAGRLDRDLCRRDRGARRPQTQVDLGAAEAKEATTRGRCASRASGRERRRRHVRRRVVTPVLRTRSEERARPPTRRQQRAAPRTAPSRSRGRAACRLRSRHEKRAYLVGHAALAQDVAAVRHVATREPRQGLGRVGAHDVERVSQHQAARGARP